MTVVPGDLNGDGTPDLIGYPAFGHFFSRPHPILHAFSGRDGRQLWTAPIDVTNLVSDREGLHGIHGVDLDGDGLTEILFVAVLDYEYPAANFPSTDRTQLWCFVLSGRDGTIRWKQPLSQPYGLGASAPNAVRRGLLDVTELVQGDLDGDGVLDIIVPAERLTGPEGWELRALSGKDGRLIWRRPLAPCVEPGDAYLRYVPPVIADWDDEEGLVGILLEFTDRTLAGELGSTVRLTCFSARDGQEIWTWETEVAEGTGQTLPFSRREILENRPRPVVLRGGIESKPCVAINLWGGAESGQLIVIDHTGKELERTDVAGSLKSFRAWAVDIDRDGRDELVLLNREQVVALRFDNLSEPLWRRAIRPGMTRILDIAQDSLDERQLVVVAGNPFDGRLMALDSSSGDVVWSCAGPRRGEQFNLVSWDDVRFLNPSAPSDTPQFAFVLDGMAVCRQGLRTRLASQVPIEHLSLDSFTSSDRPIRDPRLARPLFNQMGDRAESQRANFRAIAWGAFFSLTLIIVPFRFVAKSIRIGRWSLRWMLLVPAVVAMMLVVATLRVPDIRHMDVGSGVVVPKFIAGLLLLPPTLFVLYLIELSWRWRWKSILLWSLLVLGLAGLNGLVLIQARGSAEGMTWEPGEYYSWQGWYVFLLFGVYHAGVLVLLFRGARMLWMIARRFISSGRRPPQGSPASV